MKITYENATDQITIQDAIELYEIGIATIITDGRDVTFEIEKRKLTKVSNYKIPQFHCIIGAVGCQERSGQNGNLLGLHI